MGNSVYQFFQFVYYHLRLFYDLTKSVLGAEDDVGVIVDWFGALARLVFVILVRRRGATSCTIFSAASVRSHGTSGSYSRTPALFSVSSSQQSLPSYWPERNYAISFGDQVFSLVCKAWRVRSGDKFLLLRPDFKWRTTAAVRRRATRATRQRTTDRR